MALHEQICAALRAKCVHKLACIQANKGLHERSLARREMFTTNVRDSVILHFHQILQLRKFLGMLLSSLYAHALSQNIQIVGNSTKLKKKKKRTTQKFFRRRAI